MYEIQELKIGNECILEAKFTGNFERDLAFKFIDTLGEYEAKYPNIKLLVDFSDVSKVSIDFRDLKSIVQYVQDYDKRQGNAVFVTGPDFSKYMLAKLFVDLVSIFKPNQKNAFRRMEKAISWLCPKSAWEDRRRDFTG